MDGSCEYIIHAPDRIGSQQHSEDSACFPLFIMNLDFSKRLRHLECKGLAIQYQLACLSTLGGAYHLTNRPETAFMIAHRQELVGRLLGSISVIIRAKVFQAVNLYLLGHKKASKRVFEGCRRLVAENQWSGMGAFVEASELWVRVQRSLQLQGKSQGAISQIGEEATCWDPSMAVTSFTAASSTTEVESIRPPNSRTFCLV